MRLAALIHDLGKLLSLFGKPTRMSTAPTGPWGSTEMGASRDPGAVQPRRVRRLKLRGFGLPRRVELVIRFHSLFDLRNATVPDDHAMPWLQPAMNLYDMDLNPADERARDFILHFSHYDQKAKRATDYIPDVDLVEIEALLVEAFPPDGRIPF